MLKCIAVDDEKYVLDLLVDNIRQVPFLELRQDAGMPWKPRPFSDRKK